MGVRLSAVFPMLPGILVVAAWVVLPLARGDDGDGTGPRRRPLWPTKPEKSEEKPAAKPRRPLWPGRKPSPTPAEPPASAPEDRPLWPSRRGKPEEEPAAKPRRGLWPGGERRPTAQVPPIVVPPPMAEADLNLYEFLWFNGPEPDTTKAQSLGVGSEAAFLAAGIQSKTPPPPPLPPEQAPPGPVMVAVSSFQSFLRDPQVVSDIDARQPRLAERSPGAVSARLQPAGPPSAGEPDEPPDSTAFPMGLVTKMTEPRSGFGLAAVEELSGPAPEFSDLPIRLASEPPPVVALHDVPDPTRGTFDRGLVELASVPVATRRPASPRGPAEGWSRSFERFGPVVVTEEPPGLPPVVARTEEPERPQRPHRIMWPTPVPWPTAMEMPAAGLVVTRFEQLRWRLVAPAIDGPAVSDSVVGDEMHQSQRQRLEVVAIPPPELDAAEVARAAGPVVTPLPPQWRGMAVGVRRIDGRMRISARLQAMAGARIGQLVLAGRTSPVGPPPAPPHRQSPVPLPADPGDWSRPTSLPLLTVIRQARHSRPGRTVKRLKRPRPFAGFDDDGRLIVARRQVSDDLDDLDLVSPAPLPGLTETRHWLGSGSGRGSRKTRRRSPSPWRLQ